LDQAQAKEREELDRKMAKALVGERKTEGPAPVKEQSTLRPKQKRKTLWSCKKCKTI
jgi:hypothetical protein